MAVLISDSNGRKCDGRCYDAKNPRCDCICGGKNHGVGLRRAIEQTREVVDEAAGHKLGRLFTEPWTMRETLDKEKT
jgi:hypothetical protein